MLVQYVTHDVAQLLKLNVRSNPRIADGHQISNAATRVAECSISLKFGSLITYTLQTFKVKGSKVKVTA